MRQVVMTSPGELEYRDAEVPRPGRGQVLLRIRRIGVCGSDVHVYHGTHPFTSYPVVQGHEFSATVEAVGPDVADVPVGAKVTAMPQIFCGRCACCRRGDYHICEKLKVMGFQAPGVAQDLFAIAAEKVLILPGEFTYEQGAMVEPAAVAVHAVGRAAPVAGRNAVVLGAGPIGNLVAQSARAEGANVLIGEVSRRRLDVARQCGLRQRFDAGAESLSDAAGRVFGRDGFDLLFECAGAEATIAAAVESIAKGGTIVQVALFAQSPRVNLSFLPEHEKSIIGSMMYKREDYVKAIELIGSGDIVTEPLISKHFPFENYLAAYECIDRRKDEVMKIMIDL